MLKKSKIICIVNPASGKDFPILAVLNHFFKTNKIHWDLHITQKDDLNFLKKDYNFAILYGGDGTVTDYLKKIDIPTLILHGGTANTIAKNLKIPKKPDLALNLLIKGQVLYFDAFKINNRKHFLHAYTGSLAQKMKNIKRKDKDLKGVVAYIEAFF